ncbi:CAP domain-containing protein [Euzebyella marina]|uniref:CAP domain-containing protein n=1 Tax=Euzebyella marina TaxID=1761453 RepID=A0A3G2L1W6_9FLAO|nr:CAP domain-containing protein [Euzebyella marina]AYN66257.1 CAP domain-containing protein [Euzebyella marina]
MRNSICSILFTGCILIFSACEKDQPEPENEELSTNLDSSAKSGALQLYNDFYVASTNDTNDVAWTGNVSSCTPGTVPQETQTKILQRINYYRHAVGLPPLENVNTDKSGQAQQAALMMHANNSLNHFPPSNWSCYTEDGSTAAANSLLTSAQGAAAVVSYIRDHGAANGPVGHRRWLLWPRLNEIGIGNTSQYNALWVIGNPGPRPQDTPEFIAWPPEGFIPKQVVYPRWSFSIASADFNNTEISMRYKNGESISVQQEELDSNYGDATIVWVPNINTNTLVEDTVVEVTVRSVGINGVNQDFDYEVILFDPTAN